MRLLTWGLRADPISPTPWGPRASKETTLRLRPPKYPLEIADGDDAIETPAAKKLKDIIPYFANAVDGAAPREDVKLLTNARKLFNGIQSKKLHGIFSIASYDAFVET